MAASCRVVMLLAFSRLPWHCSIVYSTNYCVLDSSCKELQNIFRQARVAPRHGCRPLSTSAWCSSGMMVLLSAKNLCTVLIQSSHINMSNEHLFKRLMHICRSDLKIVLTADSLPRLHPVSNALGCQAHLLNQPERRALPQCQGWLCLLDL